MLGIGLRTIRRDRRNPIASLASSGEISFTTPGTYTWTCPEGVTSVCAVAIGGGGGGGNYFSGGGGAKAWRNKIPVAPGQQITVVVGRGAQQLVASMGFGGNGAVRVIWGGGRSFPNNSV